MSVPKNSYVVHTEIHYGGYIITEGAHGWTFRLEDDPAILTRVPGASSFATEDEALRAVAVMNVVDGDGQKFWHLWRAIKGFNSL